MSRLPRKFALLLAALCVLGLTAGCSETENDSQLPWNTPKGWEGAPPGMGMPGTGSGSY